MDRQEAERVSAWLEGRLVGRSRLSSGDDDRRRAATLAGRPSAARFVRAHGSTLDTTTWRGIDVPKQNGATL